MDERIRTESDFGAAVRRDGVGDPSGVARAFSSTVSMGSCG